MKYLILSAIVFLLTACQKHDLHFYRLHPRDLQEAMNECPSQIKVDPSCEQLGKIAVDINQLVSELQQNPQDFGGNIITLQTHLVTMQTQYNKLSDLDKKSTPLDKSINDLKEKLAMRLAIVKWLESPER